MDHDVIALDGLATFVKMFKYCSSVIFCQVPAGEEFLLFTETCVKCRLNHHEKNIL